MLAKYLVPWGFFFTWGMWTNRNSAQTSAVPASSPTKIISTSGSRRFQLSMALRWITAMCPTKGLGVENIVNMALGFAYHSLGGGIPPRYFAKSSQTLDSARVTREF